MARMNGGTNGKGASFPSAMSPEDDQQQQQIDALVDAVARLQQESSILPTPSAAGSKVRHRLPTCRLVGRRRHRLRWNSGRRQVPVGHRQVWRLRLSSISPRRPAFLDRCDGNKGTRRISAQAGRGKERRCSRARRSLWPVHATGDTDCARRWGRDPVARSWSIVADQCRTSQLYGDVQSAGYRFYQFRCEPRRQHRGRHARGRSDREQPLQHRRVRNERRRSCRGEHYPARRELGRRRRHCSGQIGQRNCGRRNGRSGVCHSVNGCNLSFSPSAAMPVCPPLDQAGPNRPIWARSATMAAISGGAYRQGKPPSPAIRCLWRQIRLGRCRSFPAAPPRRLTSRSASIMKPANWRTRRPR